MARAPRLGGHVDDSPPKAHRKPIIKK